MDIYFSLAREALDKIEVKYLDSDNLPLLINKLRYSILLPASQTEGNIKSLCESIAEKLESNADPTEITQLIDNLYSEATFNLFD